MHCSDFLGNLYPISSWKMPTVHEEEPGKRLTFLGAAGFWIWSMVRWCSLGIPQVWSLTHFFLISCCKKSLVCQEGKSMTPRQEKTYLLRFFQQLPRLCLRPLWGFLSWHGSLQGPSACFIGCFRNYRNTRTQPGHRTQSKTTDANLDNAFVENELFTTDPWSE